MCAAEKGGGFPVLSLVAEVADAFQFPVQLSMGMVSVQACSGWVSQVEVGRSSWYYQ
jgi:hypothetical protein